MTSHIAMSEALFLTLCTSGLSHKERLYYAFILIAAVLSQNKVKGDMVEGLT